MAGKVRIRLVMPDGTQVRGLEDLREHFDLESVLGYYQDGKLLKWLRGLYMEAEADTVETLDEKAPDFQKKLCEALDVEYTGVEADLEVIQRRKERLDRLRAITDESEVIQHVDQVAFDQEDLADLLDEGVETIYLCGEKFIVPASMIQVNYIGIEQPKVHISGKITEQPETLEQRFTKCNVDNLPQKMLQSKLEEGTPEQGGYEYKELVNKFRKNLDSAIDTYSHLSKSSAYLNISTSDFKMDVYPTCNYDKSARTGYPSKLKCEEVAEGILRKIYNRNEAEYKKLVDSSSSKSFYTYAQKSITAWCKERREDLKDIHFGDDILKTKIRDLLTSEAVIRELAIKNDSLKCCYSSPTFGEFISKIEYSKSDNGEYFDGFEKIAARALVKTMYGYNLYDAAADIHHEFQALLDNYAKDFHDIVTELLDRYIVEPIKNLLDEMD